MIVLMTMAYLACVFVAFKVVKIKVRPVSVAVAALLGVVLLGGIVSVWKLAAPMTGQMTLRRTVVRIVPNQREFVSKVHVESDDLVKKGQPLFEVSQERYKNAVDAATATLKQAENTALQARTTIAGSEASLRKAVADEGIAKAKVDVARKLQRSAPGAVAKLQIAEAEASYQAARAGTQLARARLEGAKASHASALKAVDVHRAALKSAEYQLEQTVYRSSVDGRVINFQIREQTPVARWQFVAVGTIMDLSNSTVIAIYPQNLLSNVSAGDPVEIAFRRTPGAIATGKVETVVKFTGEGQLPPAAKMPVVATLGSKGFLPVRIRLDDAELARTLPMGAAGTVAIYSGFGKPFHVISKIVVRIKGWLYYLPV